LYVLFIVEQKDGDGQISSE